MKPCLARCLAAAIGAFACCQAIAAPPTPAADPLNVDFTAIQRSPSLLPGPPDNNVTLRLAASLTKSLPRDWMVRASVNTQYNNSSLSLEQTFAPSAVTSLRLIAQRDYMKDGGFASNVELYSPNLCATVRKACRAVMFYDRNYIKYNREINGQLRSGNVGSVGVGLRMQLNRGSNLQLDYGRVVRSNQMPDDARSRLTLRLGYSFN